MAENVIIPYCDFCSLQEPDARTYDSCALCRSLVCVKHQVIIQYHSENPSRSDEWRDRRVNDQLSGRSLRQSDYGRICPECAKESLATLVARLKEAREAEMKRGFEESHSRN